MNFNFNARKRRKFEFWFFIFLQHIFHTLIVGQLRNRRLVGVASDGFVEDRSDALTSSQGAVEDLVKVLEVEFLRQFDERHALLVVADAGKSGDGQRWSAWEKFYKFLIKTKLHPLPLPLISSKCDTSSSGTPSDVSDAVQAQMYSRMQMPASMRASVAALTAAQTSLPPSV